MIRFIWQNWWRRKDRFILLLVGALIVSSGLSFLVGLSEANKGTIVDALQRRWSASYDIVVRPPGSRSVTEEKNLLEPDYLSGLSGGISLEQYNKIRQMDDVAVAAPIAMIGYINYNVAFQSVDLEKKGVYRLHQKRVTDTGPRTIEDDATYYFPIGWDVTNKGGEYGVGLFEGQLIAATDMLLAGIDPQAEAELVGLDQAVLDRGDSRYFQEDDEVEGRKEGCVSRSS